MNDRWNSRKVLLVLPVAGMIAAIMVVMLAQAPAVASHACPAGSVQINPGNDLDALVNADSSTPTTATTFCVHAGTYTISEPLKLKTGDKLVGQPGTTGTQGPATDPNPVVKVEAGSGVDEVIRAIGSNILVEWLEITGAKATSGCTGSGVGIAAGSTDGTFVAQYNYIHHNDSVGIGNAHGKIFHNEFTQNTLKSSCVGVNGAAVKGGTEYEAAYNYVHDEQGNGLWCDRGCDDDPTSGLTGFIVHHNLVVNNARGGIRIENSPTELTRIEYNEVHGNSFKAVRGGVSIRDSQNVLVQFNIFGGNADNVAIRASDSGRAGRTDLRNVDILDNTLNGETIKGCELPDEIVDCSGQFD
jgi:hypothetical protein